MVRSDGLSCSQGGNFSKRKRGGRGGGRGRWLEEMWGEEGGYSEYKGEGRGGAD